MFLNYSPSSAATTEEYSEFLSSSQLSAVEPEPATTATVPTDAHDKQYYNSMIHMVSFLEQQADEMGYSRDDVPPCFSEPQTPTVTRYSELHGQFTFTYTCKYFMVGHYIVV